jgi:hypothetical protein
MSHRKGLENSLRYVLSRGIAFLSIKRVVDAYPAVPSLLIYHTSLLDEVKRRQTDMATNSYSFIPSTKAQKMQYFSSSHSSQQTVDSPSYSKRASVVFVNDYASSSLNNLAPAANDDYSRLERRASEASTQKEHSGNPSEPPTPKSRTSLTSKLGSRFVRKGKEASLSPPRSSLPTREKSANANQIEPSAPPPTRLQTQEKHQKPSKDEVLKDGFSKVKLRDELQVDFPTNRSAKKSEKMPGKERRKVFQRLADEKVPDEQKFKNRKLKSDYIKGKFGSSVHDDSTDLSTCGTSGGPHSDRRSSFSDFFPPPNDIDIDDNFVDGLIFFAPTSEGTIRELVQKRSPSA